MYHTLVQLTGWVWNHISHAYLTVTADEHIPNARIPVKLNLMNKRERLLLYFTHIQSECCLWSDFHVCPSWTTTGKHDKGIIKGASN